MISQGDIVALRMQEADRHGVYTPSTEPYRGREAVERFDRLIVVSLNHNVGLAERSRRAGLTDLQIAACQLVPQGIKLALSIRELVRQGYLFAARVLMRSLMERTAILFYLESHPGHLSVWKNGWKPGKRPTLPAMLEHIGEHRLKFLEIKKGFVNEYHSLVHGDLSSSVFNLSFNDQGEPVFGVSKDLASPEVCDRVCHEASVWLGELMLMAERVLPDTRVDTS